MTDSATPRTLNERDAARAIGVSLRTVQRMIARGELRAVRAGRRVVVPLVAIDEFLSGAIAGAQRS